MLRYFLFTASLLLLVWSVARMSVLWAIAAYILAGVFWVAHERQKDILYQSVATNSNPLLVVALWPVTAGFAAMLRMRSLTSAERYVVNYGGLSYDQQAHFRTWQEALSFARRKTAEQGPTARESASLFEHVVIVDRGRLRSSPLGGLKHAQFEVQDSGAIRRIV